MLRLRDEASVEIADAGREIAARVQDLRIGGAQHRLAHLLDDREQAMLDDRYGDGIDGVGQGFLAGVRSAVILCHAGTWRATSRWTASAMYIFRRHGRAGRRPSPSHPRLSRANTWMAGTSPAMTTGRERSLKLEDRNA